MSGEELVEKLQEHLGGLCHKLLRRADLVKMSRGKWTSDDISGSQRGL